MTLLHTLYAWAVAHPTELPLALAAMAAVARTLYALLSRLVAPYPRLRALVEALAAGSPDVIRAGQQLASAVLGRAVPSLDQRAPDDDREALRARVAELEGQLGMQRATTPPRDNPQRGRASASTLLTALLVSVLSAGLVVGGCRPQPGPDGEVHTPSGVVATIDTIATILEVLLPVIRPLILREVPDGPAKPAVTYSLVGFEAAANAWMAGHTTWDARGADRCTAYALSGALVDATKSLSRDLARAGIGWGPDIEALLTSLGRLMDRYLGVCSDVVDGGALTASGRVGSAVQMYLDDLRVEAQLRGRSLRPLPAVRR